MRRNVIEWIWISAILIFTVSLVAFAAPTKCHWNTCFVVDGLASQCAAEQAGTPEEMLKAEIAQRGRGLMLIRECVEPGQPPALDWAATTQKRFFNRSGEK